MGKADLHIHTTASDGLLGPQEVVEYAATCTDLSVIAIADHDTLEGAWKAWHWLQAHPRLRVELLWGVELTTAWFKHLLCYWPDRPPRRLPRRFQSPTRVLAEMMETGAICVAAHPTNPVSFTPRDLAILAGRGLTALEACNPVLGRRREGRLRVLAGRLGLGVLGGSDTHGLLQTIGATYTCFPGSSRDNLVAALLARTTDARWSGVAIRAPLATHVRQFLRSWILKPGLLQKL